MYKRQGAGLIQHCCCEEWCREQNLEFDAVNDHLPEIIEFYGLVVLLNYQNVIDILKKKNGNKLLLNGTGVEQMGKS